MGKAFDKELTDLISAMIAIITNETDLVEMELDKWQHTQGDSLEKLAKIAECKIQRAQLKKIRRQTLALIKGSTNRLIISTIQPSEN